MDSEQKRKKLPSKEVKIRFDSEPMRYFDERKSARARDSMVTGLTMTGGSIEELRPLLRAHHYLGAKTADPMHVFLWRQAGGLLGDTGEPVAGIVYASPINRYFGKGCVELTISSGNTRWKNPNTGEIVSGRSFDQRRPEYKTGWERVRSASKFLYVKPLRERRSALMKRFEWSPLPYPKPDREIQP